MDINIAYDPAIMGYDMAINANGDIETGDDLKTAVLTSLFTWARAKPDDYIPEGEPSYGWWGECLTDNPLSGSRLWLLQRAKQGVRTVSLAEESAREALEWLKDEGIASDINVTAEASAGGRITLDITITRYGGEKERLKYTSLWEEFVR